jgi:hypothetical protein
MTKPTQFVYTITQLKIYSYEKILLCSVHHRQHSIVHAFLHNVPRATQAITDQRAHAKNGINLPHLATEHLGVSQNVSTQLNMEGVHKKVFGR